MEVKHVIWNTEGMRALGELGISERIILKWNVGK
jgi:hypothetical protein